MKQNGRMNRLYGSKCVRVRERYKEGRADWSCAELFLKEWLQNKLLKKMDVSADLNGKGTLEAY